MFICNIKLDKSKLLKTLFILIIVIIIISLLFWIYSLINNSNKVFVNDDVEYGDVVEIKPENYTAVLKNSHENIDMYVGKKIKFSGFIYRLYDFTDSQFVLGREMILSVSNNQAQTVVVGFLCEYSEAASYSDGTWVEIEGTITKGTYHSELPVLQITSLKQVESPSDPFVYPPTGTEIATISVH